jgi:hypothetical protein
MAASIAAFNFGSMGAVSRIGLPKTCTVILFDLMSILCKIAHG